MYQSLSSFTPNELLDYKEDMIDILKSQIQVLKQINEKILIHEEKDLTLSETSQRLLTRDKSLEFIQILQGEITKVKSFDVVLAVVGTMKAGKSTTVNAIVGREILPNRNRPMTALPTLICHNPNQYEPVLTFKNSAINEFLKDIRDKFSLAPDFKSNVSEINDLIDFIKSKQTFNSEYLGSDNIFLFLQRLNDLVRLSAELNTYLLDMGLEGIEFPYASYRNLEELPIIETTFRTIDNSFETQGRFMLLDTPGPNEAGQSELKVMLREQLERSSAVLLVLDYTQLNSEAEADVKNQISAIPTVQKSRLFAVVNKFDQKTANSDDQEKTINHVYKSLLSDLIEKENIYPISAQDAYLASRMTTALAENRNVKPAYKEGTWIEDFADIAYGRKAEIKYNNSDEDELNDIIEELIDDSMTAPLLNDVIYNMQRNAPIIAIQSGLVGSSKVFNDLHNFFSIRSMFAKKEQLTDEQISELQNSIHELSIQINDLSMLRKEVLGDISNNIENTFSEIQNSITMLEQESRENINNLFSSYPREDGNSDDKENRLINKIKSANDRTQDQEAQKKIREIINQHRDDNSILFSTQEDLQQFLDSALSVALVNLQQNIASDFNSLKRKMQLKIQSEFKSVEIQVHTILENIQHDFNKNNIQLIFDFDLFSKSDGIFDTPSPAKVNYEEVTNTITVKKTGITSVVSRLVGGLIKKEGWGYENVKRKTYRLNKAEVLDELNTKINQDIFIPLKTELDNEKTRVENLIINKVTDIESTCNSLIQEFSFCIEQEKMPDLEKKIAYKNELGFLNDKYNETQEDWNVLANKFNIKALSNKD